MPDATKMGYSERTNIKGFFILAAKVVKQKAKITIARAHERTGEIFAVVAKAHQLHLTQRGFLFEEGKSILTSSGHRRGETGRTKIAFRVGVPKPTDATV